MNDSAASTSELPLRLAMGVALIAFASVLIYWGGISEAGGWAFRGFVALGAGIMLIEWSDIHKVSRPWGYAGAVVLVALLLIAGETLFPAGEMDTALSPESFTPAWIGFGGAIAGAILLGLVTRRLVMVTGFIYIAIPAFALIVLEWAWFGLAFWAMLVTWATDIFAYFAGRGLGGPKLAPRISPNKTWAGLAGGVIGAALVGWLAARFFDLGMPFAFIGAPMAILAQAGDLYESSVKRRAGVKDSGTLLPGHGGLLDRLDGLLPVLVATLALPMAGLWTG